MLTYLGSFVTWPVRRRLDACFAAKDLTSGGGQSENDGLVVFHALLMGIPVIDALIAVRISLVTQSRWAKQTLDLAFDLE